MTNGDDNIIDFIDLINFTLSNKFADKWRHKFSPAFIKLFQFKVLKCMEERKTIKKSTMFTYFTKRCKYSPDQVNTFFKDIDVDIYHPLIQRK